MAIVKVKLHSVLCRYGQSQVEEIDLPANTTVQQLMDRYGFAPGEVGVVTVNGQLEGRDHSIGDDSVVEFYPVFGGG